ncbi:unnamed protein product [Thelazia callipaeda]|uniref:Protein kinase domain-containing protein n=1 Tax=Thelazia callipaeda TaxID=103827 RepID=A0A0N5D496_THECL|nr:unnamed protein product [Thelazia callipaeda]
MVTQDEECSDEELVICDRFRLVHKITKGTFGTVILGMDLFNDNEVAIKMETKSNKRRHRLLFEYDIYRNLKAEVGFPEAFWYGSQGDFNILVMELLGPSLEDLFNFCGGRFTLKTVLLLADQLLARLQALHEFGVIHRDIKPDNFAMGLGSKHNILIDMGLCKKIWSASEHKDHNPCLKKRAFCGTLRFASPNAHQGVELCRRDDLISLAYALLYFMKGDLPWFKCRAETIAKSSELIFAVKNEISVEELCTDCPEEFMTFIKYCNELEFSQVPDYKEMRRLFWTLFLKKQFAFDNVFDWDLYK